MASPTVSASLNKLVYAPGETMTLTVNYSDPDTKAIKVSIVVTDSTGVKSAPAEVTAVIDPVTISISDPSGKTWTKVSDTGSVAVFTATA